MSTPAPASPDLLQPSREFSLPMPQYDVLNPEPAVITIVLPAYVLCFMTHLMAWICSRHRRFLQFRSRQDLLRLGHWGRWLRHRLLWIRFAGTAGVAAPLGAAATRSGSADSKENQCYSPQLVVVCFHASR